jgi:hypothetical protein
MPIAMSETITLAGARRSGIVPRSKTFAPVILNTYRRLKTHNVRRALARLTRAGWALGRRRWNGVVVFDRRRIDFGQRLWN